MKEKTITLDQLVRWVGAGLLVLGVLLLVNYLSSVLLPFFVAWFFAYLLYPIVPFIQYKCRVKSRILSIIITVLLILGIIVGPIVKLVFANRISPAGGLGLLENLEQHAPNLARMLGC